ncbi:MAG: ISL3 family transposase [Oscillatoriales cyanobacterium RU_3_3]|nr:ISL3 family transposase [Microcoleus sp. SU_5_6]NJM59747.1 ISL3 family transposase [Oscillatoriales cyanobacterium RU_3_3]NJR21305.1 ISL3 family transposase [Richelia sp. CSU_2_1]
MESPMTGLINLPSISVVSSFSVEDAICFELKILASSMACPHCGQSTKELHQIRPILVRDLPVFGQPAYLKIPRRNFYCRHCQKYVTERLEFLDWRRPYTKRYEANIYQRVLQQNVAQVSREEGLTWAQVEGIFKSVNNYVKTNWQPAERLGMDEVSKKKGHQNFVTVISDLERGCLIEAIDSHKQKEIIEFLKKQPESVRDCVKEVSVDMWGGFPKVIEEVFPNAAIVIDRFHVMKLVNGQLNKIRRLAGVKPAGSRYLLLKNQADLTSIQKEQLALILKHSACLSIAYEMKEEFREIYETSKTVAEGRSRMEKWLESAELFYAKTARTIRQHLVGICNYFMNRTTSGVMEGINNKIKLIMRNGYGFHNFDNLRSRLLGCFSSSG